MNSNILFIPIDIEPQNEKIVLKTRVSWNLKVEWVYEVQLQKLNSSAPSLFANKITSPHTQNSFSSDLNQISFSKST